MQKIQDYIELLKPVFNGDIRFDTITRKLYSTDASIYQIEPMGVLLPKDQESLIAAVELAAQYKLPLLPRGSGSSLAGQAVGDAIILDTSKYLNRFISPVNPETREVTVEPGVILARVNREAARYGLMFGPDPASAERATIGGVIGNNATGAHSIRYGMTADHIVSADTVLADGSLATWGEVTSGGVTHNAMFDQVIGLARKIRVKGAEDIQKGGQRLGEIPQAIASITCCHGPQRDHPSGKALNIRGELRMVGLTLPHCWQVAKEHLPSSGGLPCDLCQSRVSPNWPSSNTKT